MKKKNYNLYGFVLLWAAIYFLPSGTNAQNSFQLNGSGGQADLGNNCYRLTTAAGNQNGSAWWRKKADLGQDFDMSANLNFGTLDAGGADGIVFAFQNVCTSAGGIGGGLGIANVSPSVFVEFDTWANPGDPSYDHVAIQKNGDVSHSVANQLAAPVGIVAGNGNVENGQDYLVRILWTSADTTLKVYVNGDMRLSYSGDIVNRVFSGNRYVYWGFTAATGGSYNLQKFCMVNIPTNTIKLSDIAICAGDARQVSLPGASGYLWSPNTNISSTTAANPVLSPATTTTYYVSMTDACNNVQTDSIRVTVNPLPTTSLTLPFAQKCTGEAAVTLTGGTPAGGVYSGAGVNNGQFTAVTAGQGPHFIYYSYTNGNGCTGKDSSFVAVASAPNVSLANLSAVCVNSATFALTGGSPSGGSYSGTGLSGGNFNPATAGAGSHTITYTYTDQNTGCNGTATKSITVNALPVATISNTGTVLCSGNTVNLTTTAVNGVSYQWSLNGSTVTSFASGNTSYNATATGSYTLLASSQAGCTATSTAVTVTSGTTPTATISSTTIQFCPGASVTLSSSLSGSETIVWYAGNNVIANQTAGSYTATAAGAYKAIITSATGCSTTSNIITLTLLPGAVASATASLPAFCPGTTSITLSATTTNGAQYQWFSGTTPVNGQTNATYDVSAAGSYKVVVSLSGCIDTSAVITLANAINPTATLTTADSTYCAGNGEVTVTATNGATYIWKLNGNTVAGATNTLAVTQGGAYSVVVTSTDQCSATSNSITMAETGAPTASITASNTAICSGNSVTLTANTVAGATYEWNRNGTSLGAPSSANTYTASQSGDYTVVVNDGCSATSNSITLTVSSTPGSAFSISGDVLVCPGGFDQYTINAVSGATGYTWSVTPAGGAFIQDGQGTNDAVVTFLNQNVTVTVVAYNACGTGAPTTKAVDISSAFVCNGTSVAFGASPSNTCVGSTVTFNNYSDQTAVGALDPVWDFGPGATPATSTASGPVTVTYSTPGYKTVSLKYKDFAGNEIDAYEITDYINISGAISTSAITGNTNLTNCNGATESYSVVNTTGSTYNWTVTGGSVASGQGTNAVTVTFNSAGGVSVVETNAAGCVGAPVNVAVSCPTGTNDLLSLRNSFNLYPNPTSGVLSVDFSANTNAAYQLQLFSIDGKETIGITGNANAAGNKQQLDLSSLAKGVYFLRLQTGNEIVSRKVVLQ